MCVHELIGASVVCYAEGWRDGGKGGGGDENVGVSQ